MKYCTTCSTAPSHGAIGPKLRGTRARASSATGDRRADGLAEAASGEWILPGDKGDRPLSTDDLWRFRIKARDAPGIVADARLHDLRHAHASQAAMNGESLHVAGRLLGHRRASTTNRYVHLDDSTLWHAAERVAVAIKSKLQPSTD
ncbi:MAG: tyrosine-type recombinase/integrase [Rhodobacteraceae bacterium]|nr:tyrosine-type recombinase/integrase [Paracoccaceae bacterium]